MNALNAQPGEIKPFTRVITTPPAFPWDQEKAAQLDARHTSPMAGMSGGGLTIVVKRLKPWRPKESGRFAAVYLKGNVPPQGLSFMVDVQGQPVKVEIASKTTQAAQLRQRAWLLGAIVVVILSLVLQIGLVLKRRAEVEDRLAQLQPQIERMTKLNAGQVKTRQNAQALSELELQGRDVQGVVNALRTVTISRDPSARIEAFHWDRGDWALEVRGEVVPLKAGAVDLQKAPKPVRRGVSLWVYSQPRATTPVSTERVP